MGNNFNELRWKIIRANNLQFIHQVTIEFRFRKSLAQERFKSNLEFRYQIIVSSIKFRKGFSKFMIPIALFKKFLSSGLQIFFKIGGPTWPMEQKMVGHFLKWWAQAYQTNHSWHLGCILYLQTDTDTFMHICILTADYTVKPVLSGHSKKKTNYRLMQVKSIAECSLWSILQYFRPSLSYQLFLRSLFCLFWVAA